MQKKRWLSILLSLFLLLTLLPAQAFAEEGTDGTEIACTQTSDCPAQVHEPDCPLWQEDSTDPDETGLNETVPGETGLNETGPDESAPEETGPDESSPGETSPEEPEEPSEPEETQPTAADVLALIQALPDPAEVTAENAETVETQLRELLALYQALDADEQEEVGDAILRAIVLKAALDVFSGEDSGQAMLAETTDGVTYIGAVYNEDTGKVEYSTETTVDNVIVNVVDENTTEWAWGTADATTWYVVQGTVTTSTRITVTGTVHLILADGCELNANAGINVPQSSSLTIYGQTNGAGKLVATGDIECAGIGGGEEQSSGAVTINGGTVNANGGIDGAGIGGGYVGNGIVTINGGTVTAKGGADAAGIGGGIAGNGTVTVNGGTVTATGGGNGAGIGGGYGDSGGNGDSGVLGGSGTVTINGGTVTANGGDQAAGIGGGYSGGGTVTINGGEVEADGGVRGAGIGGGSGGGMIITNTVTINGGTVTAKGGTDGAGIGSGYDSESSTITNTVTINGGEVEATGGVGGAGIGGGSFIRFYDPQNAQNIIQINGGFVTAIGGSCYTKTSSTIIGAGAAIGGGGGWADSGGTYNGTETDERNFSNCVVLRQSGASDSTMTGTVYGSPTLTTDATVPSGATLTIPEGTSLTVGANTTLTNSGAIYQEGGSLLYGDSYGTLTNEGDGKLYYLLTIEGGTATATEGMATYNGKTYATQGTSVTLTAEDKVGMAFNGEWTASPTSANVTFTKVDENDETNQNHQFTMPAQVLTVTAGYDNTPSYTVTIPASVSIGDTATAAIEAESVNVAEGYNLNVKLTATSDANNAFTLALKDHTDVTLGYTMTLTKTTVKLGEGTDAEETTTEPNTTVNVNDTVLTIPGGTADSSGSSTLTFAMADQLKKYSGTYTGTVTFSVSVTEDTPADSDNPGDNPGGDNPGGDSDTTTDTTGDNP